MMKYECDVCDNELGAGFITMTMPGSYLDNADVEDNFEFHICTWQCMFKLSAQMVGAQTMEIPDVNLKPDTDYHVEAQAIKMDNPEGEQEGEKKKIVIRSKSADQVHGGIQMGHRDMDGYKQPDSNVDYGGVRRR